MKVKSQKHFTKTFNTDLLLGESSKLESSQTWDIVQTEWKGPFQCPFSYVSKPVNSGHYVRPTLCLDQYFFKALGRDGSHGGWDNVPSLTVFLWLHLTSLKSLFS
jgi:hypothetical protein